jgi:hypothetical protein
MQKTERRRPSPALVVASIALFIALTGTGVAAVAALPANSVGTAQLKANAVTSTKIKNAAVTNAKLGLNAVTGSKVLDQSLTSADFAEGQLPAGPQGPAGPAGAPGVSGYQQVKVQSPNDSNPTKKLTVSCPSGKKALGVGLQISGDGKRYVASNGAYPASDSSWSGEAEELVGTPENWFIQVYVICATVA